MTKYFCDLCDSECDGNLFKIPVITTKENLCNLTSIEMHLCKKCRSEIYKTIERLTNQDRIKRLIDLNDY